MARSFSAAVEFVGGAHAGETPQVSADTPDTLFAITTSDGAHYARTRDEVVDEHGQRRVVFRFDPDGTRTEQARQTFCDVDQ
jgi:hypothetical protein